MSDAKGVLRISHDPKYPIYTVTVRWVQDVPCDYEPWRWQTEGLTDGRMKNFVSLYRMYREDKDTEEIGAWYREEWWPEYVQKKLTDRSPAEPEIVVELFCRETWCLSWFEHWTFDDGRSDEEYLRSFERYVSRYEQMQDLPGTDLPEGYICLMGAEDRWRWNGGPSPDERTDPPCRCKHCREQGVVRIGH